MTPWTEVLRLRGEVAAADGGIGDLQMSLHRAVYQTAKVPYQDVVYYGDITEPTPNLVGFFARVARRLSDAGESVALYHLDQGMGGGKSHALVGLYHMAANPKGFFATHIGKDVLAEAEVGGATIDFNNARVVTLTADHFSPGKATETFGPAISLFERFLWSVFDGDRKQYDGAVAKGANKSTLQQALTTVGRPVLILLDELMDYAMDLSSAANVGMMPAEQSFLNALMDACDDVPHVAFVLVMIRTDLDREGYTPLAQDFREYLAARINRNGATIAVTETGDFAAIIRRRIFERTSFDKAAGDVAAGFQKAVSAEPAWAQHVFDRLGNGKGVVSLSERISETYPFHPDLMDLVQNEWGKTQGFQRVRSTVSIFALAALHWSNAAADHEWSPPLIGVGDLPIAGIRSRGKTGQARCLEALLNSGLLLGNDRAIQGYRAVATTDISSADGKTGQAIEIDRRLADAKVETGQPHPAVRMATALFNYSLVARSQGRRGATKAELMVALVLPADGCTSPFSSIEEVFIALSSGEGLGALEVNRSSTNQPERYWLTIKQTLRMFFNSAKNQIEEKQAYDLVWATAQDASKGQFDKIHFVPAPTENQTLSEVAGSFDSEENRLLILDPSRWSLLNGEDSKSREDIRGIMGLGTKALVVVNAASCVVAAVNTYQRRYALQAAQDVLTWKLVAEQVIESEEHNEVADRLKEAREVLKEKIRKAFRHYAYIIRKGEQLEVVFSRFDDDKLTALHGNDVWGALVTANRAVGDYYDPTVKARKRKPLAEEYVAVLLTTFDRHLTLRDVVSSFYKNPRFPMVPNIDDIREVIYKLLQPANYAGPGTGGWELAGSDGSPLHVDNAKQIAISSAQQQIRRYQAPSQKPDINPPGNGRGEKGTEVTGTVVEQDGTKASDKETGPGTSSSSGEGAKKEEGKKKPTSYSWYGVEVTNRSIADEAKRDDMCKHLRWLTAQLENEELDHQLITLKYEVMAGTDAALAAEVEARGNALQAKVQIRSEES